MSRRRVAEKRVLAGDPKYNDALVSRFINNLMKDGKKGKAEKIFYASVENVSAKLAVEDHMEMFRELLGKVKPQLEVRSKRVGGSTYQIPVEVNEDRKEVLAIRWLIAAARARSGKSMIENLTAEFLDAYNGRGNAVKKREDVHKMAEANRAFAHFAN